MCIRGYVGGALNGFSYIVRGLVNCQYVAMFAMGEARTANSMWEDRAIPVFLKDANS